jgi:hypothetical protein
VARLLEAAPGEAPLEEAEQPHPLRDIEVRLANPDGSFETAHYSFEVHPIDGPPESRAWLVRVTDITARVQQHRELEDLRTQAQCQGEILRSVLKVGGARFAAFLQRTDASMKTINGVLKRQARQTDAFRSKLEETLEEVDRVRRDGEALKLSGFTAAARLLEDSLQDLRGRGSLSGGDFLPLAVKLDQLYGQFALLRSLTSQAGPATEPDAAMPEAATIRGNPAAEPPKSSATHRVTQAGSLDNTLTALTELVAHECSKSVTLDCTGLQQVPPRYQATIKNVAIQLIRNAVMHGVETSAERQALGKPAHGTLRLEFKALPDQSFELRFQDDGCGLDPDKVRATAVARGLITEDDSSHMSDRQAIKLIFKSGYTTLAQSPGEAPHGTGMSLVRRYVHEAGGKIALATQLGHETRFKVTLPALAAAAQVA